MSKFDIKQIITDRSDASLKFYFRDVSKEKRITQEEEIELAKKIKKGDHNALNKLVTANLRFVISVAKQYQGKGLSLVDLIQEGNLGLLTAAQSFDETRGYKFISYAVWWIRQYITKALSNQCRTVRLPMNQVLCIAKYNKVSSKFEQENGRKPSLSELEEISDLQSDKVSEALTYNPSFSSLSSPINENDKGCLLDIISNTNADISIEIGSKIDQVLHQLPYREQDVLRLYYGIGVSPMQDTVIADLFDISTERVRQIKARAIKIIQAKYTNFLRDLL